MATPTAYPTLSPQMAEAFLEDFLQNGSECPLPCWWGATPGQTAWVSIQPFLQSLDADITRLGTAYLPPPLVGYEVSIPVSEDVNPLGRILIVYLTNNGIIETISPTLGKVPGYSLDKILSRYGVPSEVWLDTMDAPREGSLPFRLHLYYAQQGFFVKYAVEAELLGEKVVGCFELARPSGRPYLFLWDPSRLLSYRQVLEEGRSLEPERFRLPLEEATGISIEEFAEIYSNAESGLCIETPAEEWIGR